jgi:Domain of unknown function (DUF4224)
MRVSGRFVFQKPADPCKFHLGRADRIPTNDPHEAGRRTAHGGKRDRSAADLGRADRAHKQGLECNPESTPASQGRTLVTASPARVAGPSRASHPGCWIGGSSLPSLAQFCNHDFRRSARRSGGGIGHELRMPGRRGSVEREAVPVAFFDRFAAEKEPRLGPDALPIRNRVERVSCSDGPIDRVRPDAVARCDVVWVVDIPIQRAVAPQDQKHVPRATQLARFLRISHPRPPVEAHASTQGNRSPSRIEGSADRCASTSHSFQPSGVPTRQWCRNAVAEWPRLASEAPGTGNGEDRQIPFLRLGVRSVAAWAPKTICINNSTQMMPHSPQHDEAPQAANASRASLLLSRDELIELTGTRQPARQRRWLDARGWAYVDAFGRSQHPRVARTVFASRMIGRDPTRKSPEPDFDALNRLARTS